MKSNMKIMIPLLIIIAVGLIYLYFQDKNGSAMPEPTMQGPTMPSGPTPGLTMQGQITITDSEVLDRRPIIIEPPELLPANEIYATTEKGWTTCCSSNENSNSMATADKELYSDDAPMFEIVRPVNLVAPDLNSTARRVNFY